MSKPRAALSPAAALRREDPYPDLGEPMACPSDEPERFQTVEQLQATIASQAAEIERLQEALKTIAEDCEADYPPSPGAIKYFARAELQAKEGE